MMTPIRTTSSLMTISSAETTTLLRCPTSRSRIMHAHVNWVRSLLSRWNAQDPASVRAPEDVEFDRAYPHAIRAISRRHWTPVAVARRAAQLFQRAGARRVLDVGSGVGKFVLVAAATAPEVSFVGVEQRVHLVEVARTAQVRLRLPNASFVCGEASEIPWREFDGLYFFNPFIENLFAEGDRIDSAPGMTEERFDRDVRRTEGALRASPLGTAVVTYHGMGARIPGCYEPVRSERAGSDFLRLWVKRQEHGAVA
jgi:SAM-dependent methyltransferase